MGSLKCSIPSAPARKEAFEQIIDFTLSEKYMIARCLIYPLAEKIPN